MRRKIVLLLSFVAVWAFVLIVSVGAADWFGEVEYLEDIKVENHVKAPVSEDTPELGEPTTAARVKLSCTCTAGEHTFPAYYVSYKDNANTEMWYFTFDDVNSKLTCGGAEMGLANLIAYEFPNGITAIGCTLYCDCKDMNLKYLSFERAKTLTSMGSTWAGKNWFANAPIEEVKFGPYVTNVANWLFHNCQSLTTVDFGETSSLTTIGDYAFYNNLGLTQVILPDSVTTLGNCAFKSCVNVGAFYLPTSLTQLGLSVYSGNSPVDSCTNLYFINDKNDTSKPSVYYFPSNVKAIVGETFKNCKNLNDVMVFSENVTDVGNGWMFCGSNAVTLVFLGDMAEVASVSNQAWNNDIKIYFCNPSDKSTSDITSYARCSMVFCYAEGNTSHVKELSKSTEASCEMPKMVADYCFCGQFIPKSAVPEGSPLGHQYNGDVTYTFVSAAVEGEKCTTCLNLCGKDLVEKIPPVYVELGYSVNLFSKNPYSISNGYEINRESLELYESEMGVEIKLGFAFNSENGFTDGEVTLDSFKLRGEVANQDGERIFSRHDFIISYANEEYLDKNIVIGAYVVETKGDDERVYFINRAEDSSIGVNGFTAVSYTGLLNILC